MPQYAETVYWLTLINESGLKLNRVKPIIQRWCVSEKRSLSELFDLSPLDWETTFGLTNGEVERVLAARTKFDSQAQTLAQWQTEGVHTLIRTDPGYPRRLAHPLPPAQQPLILWAKGPVALLNIPGVTVLGGSDTPDEVTRSFITELTAALTAEGIGLISGYTKGLEREVFTAITAAPTGRAIAVLPMGINAFTQTAAALNPGIAAGQVVLLSPFAPHIPFDEKLAEARNLLIDHLALAMLIIQPNEAAQTRAITTLNRGVPVLMRRPDTPTPTHNALLEQGALLLTDTGEVLEMVQQAIIDTTLLESTDLLDSDQPADPSPAPSLLSNTNDNYALHSEAVAPIDSDEALQILSLGGEVPEILRRRLKKS